jgi:protein tyrosine phosphatase (PTP) superfamily phosphohydrolase (DUF442 family)
MNRFRSLGLAALLLSGCASTPPGPLARLGLPNFDRVNASLYRGGQPTPAGLAELARLGVATVVDLRRAGEGPPSRAEEQAIAAQLQLAYLPIRLSPITAPRRGTVETLLAAIGDPARQPIFVHCKRGADRTGTVIALYRVTRECWSAEQAIVEARRHGMAWWEFAMRRFVRSWQREVTVRGCTPAGR